MRVEEHRINTAMSYLAAFVGGWLACGACYGTGTLHWLWNQHQQLVQVETKVVPKLKTEVKLADCDRAVAVKVAQKAIASTESDDIATPDPSELHPCPRRGLR